MWRRASALCGAMTPNSDIKPLNRLYVALQPSDGVDGHTAETLLPSNAPGARFHPDNTEWQTSNQFRKCCTRYLGFTRTVFPFWSTQWTANTFLAGSIPTLVMVITNSSGPCLPPDYTRVNQAHIREVPSIR